MNYNISLIYFNSAYKIIKYKHWTKRRQFKGSW